LQNQTCGRAFNAVIAMTPGVARGPTTFHHFRPDRDDTGRGAPVDDETAVDSKPPKPRNRDDATKIIAEARRIVTPDGVERPETVKIGGIDQWVSVRGKVFYSRAGRSRRDRAHPDPRTHGARKYLLALITYARPLAKPLGDPV
jgi:hypothetical protein